MCVVSGWGEMRQLSEDPQTNTAWPVVSSSSASVEGDAPTGPRRLIGVDWSGRDLSGRDLSGCDLSHANLSGARLVKAKLVGATLFEADLTGAELVGAVLEGADLTRCRVDRAGFGQTCLREANLFGVYGAEVTFSGADLRGADLKTARLPEARLLRAQLGGCDLTGADLTGADLEGSEVVGACFDEASLRHARLTGCVGYAEASWIRADIQEVDFRGAYMVRRFIMDQNYLHEFRHQSRASGLLYLIWWVTSDCGRSVLRWSGWTAVIVVLYAMAYSLVEVDYGAHPTALSAVYYSVVTLSTLGYGDVLPVSMEAQALAMSEALLGYVMLGGLISIFANKMARRAD